MTVWPRLRSSTQRYEPPKPEGPITPTVRWVGGGIWGVRVLRFEWFGVEIVKLWYLKWFEVV